MKPGFVHGMAICAVIALSPVAFARPSFSSREADSTGDTLIQIVVHAIGNRDEGATVTRNLLALGSDIAPALLKIAARGRVSVEVEMRTFDIPITSDLRTTLLETVARLPRGHLQVEFERTATSDDAARRVACIEVLGKMGDQRDLSLLRRLAAPGSAEVGSPIGGIAAFETALGAILQRSPQARQGFAALFAATDESLTPAVIHAVERCAPTESVDMLTRALGVRDWNDELLLLSIVRVAASGAAAGDDASLETVRRYLTSADRQQVRTATRAVAALEDDLAAPLLLALLASPDEELVRAARDALRSLAGRDLGVRVEEWKRWHERETEWWSRASEACLEKLERGSASDATSAIFDLARRSLFRQRALAMLARGLERPEARIVCLACQALGQKRSREAFALLEPALTHPDPRVCEAAAEARQSIERLLKQAKTKRR